MQLNHFVGGQYLASLGTDKHTLINPGTEEVIAEYSLGSRLDIDRAVGEAHKAFVSGAWPKLSPTERVKRLRAFASGIESRAEELGTLESLNVGKLKEECIKHDVYRAAANIRFFADAAEHWSDDVFHSQATFLGRQLELTSITRRQPVGVAALIVPWNSPLMLATWKLGPCLAMGNTCVLKPSPWAPLSVLQLGEVAQEAGIPAGVVNIVPGGVEAGQALVEHKNIARVSFTGSVPTGRAVQEANARSRLAPISLELGGKSPSVVFADAPFEQTVVGVARGIFRSQGQSCVAGSRLLLEKSIYKAFMEELDKHIASLRIGDQLEISTQIGPLITEAHLLNVEAFVQSGIAEGAKLRVGGKRPKEQKKGFFFEPTIFEEVTQSMKIWREEIFGPVLTVMPFSTEEEAITLANDTEFGLSSSVWTTNIERALRVSASIDSGMTWVNSHFLRDLRAPFGGSKSSGVGYEGGRYSLEFYSKAKMTCLPYSL